MNSCPVLLEESWKPKVWMGTNSPVTCLPVLWSQMDPGNRQQLAQQIAELIRRIRLPRQEMEVNVDELS